VTEVVEISDPDALAPWQLTWQALFEQTPDASFFQNFAWLQAYWRHFGSRQKLRVLAVKVQGRTIGILPLCVRTEKYRIGPLRVLTYPLRDWGSFFGPVGPLPTATLLAGLRHVQQTPRDWDLIDLRWIRAASRQHAAIRAAMRQLGWPAHEDEYARIALVEFTGGWESYFARHPSKWRSNCRRNERLLARRGEVRYLRYRPLPATAGEGHARMDLYAMCEQVARSSWQNRASNSTALSHAAVADFLRDAHAQAARLGMVDLNLLLLDGRPISFAYNYHYRGAIQGLRAGFDPEFAKEGAGATLYKRMIEDSFGRGDRLLDMGPEYLEYKRHFGTSIISTVRYRHYSPRGLRAQILRTRHWLKRSTAEPLAQT